MLYHIEPFDLLDVSNARLTTGTMKVGVTQITHRMAPGEPFTTKLVGVRDRVIGQITAWLTVGADVGKPQFPPERLMPGLSQSLFYIDETGEGRTETVLAVVPPLGHDIEYYDWRWTLEGESLWCEARTTEPVLRLPNLPPGRKIVWTCRAKTTQAR